MSGCSDTNSSNCDHGFPPSSRQCSKCRLDRLEKHKNYQIDENRAVYDHLMLLEGQIKSFEQHISNLETGLDECFDRIEELENLKDTKKIEDIIFQGAKTHASILKCEKDIQDTDSFIKTFMNTFYKSIGEIRSKITQLEEKKEITIKVEDVKKIYRCITCCVITSFNILNHLDKFQYIEIDQCDSCKKNGLHHNR